MTVRSLGYRTDLIFPAFDGETIDRGDYLVVRTPANPGYHWGNFLLFDRPPGEGDADRWRGLFAIEIGGPPGVRHQAFGWDDPDGAEGVIAAFLEAGFDLIRSVVMTAGRVEPAPRHDAGIAVRPLATAAEWAAALELQMLCRPAAHAEGEYRVFRERQMTRYRAMIAAGRGAWFGAFLGERLVGDLGIFRDGDTGRFQHVETHPGHRGRGVCSALVFEASRHAFERMGVSVLVMVAGADSAAARVYHAVGFRPAERQAGLERWEKSED